MKYGWENIKHEVLFSNLTKERAKNLEIELIRHYRLLGISLNVTEGGEGTTGIIPWNYKKKLSYEQSNKLKGKHLSDSTVSRYANNHRIYKGFTIEYK